VAPIFPGYWNRPGRDGARAARRLVLYRRSGRSKRARKLAHQRPHQEPDYSEFRHNIAPEPVEGKIAQLLRGATGRGGWQLDAGISVPLVTGGVERAAVQAALDAVNPELPHYRPDSQFHW